MKKIVIFGKELHGASAHTAHPVQREDPPLHGLHCSRQWSRCGAHGENFHVPFGPTVAAPNFPRPLQLQARCFWKSPEVASVGTLRRKTMKMKMQEQPWNKVLQFARCTVLLTVSMLDFRGYTLGCPTAQDSSHHQDYYDF